MKRRIYTCLISILLFSIIPVVSLAEENCASVITALNKTQIRIFHNPQSYTLQKLNSHDIVFLGTFHKKPPIFSLISGLIPYLITTKVTHLGLEISSDQQHNLDHFVQTGKGLDDIRVHPQIDFPQYRKMLTTLQELDQHKRPSVIALDLPTSMYHEETTRDEWMAMNISKIFRQNSHAKMLVIVGTLHVLKKIEWEDQVPDPHGFIYSYLKKMAPSLKVFSIGQVIDESPEECDFTKNFGPIKGMVAMDCTKEFNGWKIGILFPVAIA